MRFVAAGDAEANRRPDSRPQERKHMRQDKAIRSDMDWSTVDTSRIIVRPDFSKKFVAGVGLTLLNQRPDQFAEFLKADRENYAVRVKNINVKLD